MVTTTVSPTGTPGTPGTPPRTPAPTRTRGLKDSRGYRVFQVVNAIVLLGGTSLRFSNIATHRILHHVHDSFPARVQRLAVHTSARFNHTRGMDDEQYAREARDISRDFFSTVRLVFGNLETLSLARLRPACELPHTIHLDNLTRQAEREAAGRSGRLSPFPRLKQLTVYPVD